jgi:hypothetical protein
MTRTLVLTIVAVLSAAGPRTARADDEKLPGFLEGKPKTLEKGDDEVRKLLKERYNAALSEVQARYEQYLAGKYTLDALYDAGGRLLKSELELCTKPAERVAVRQKYLEMTKDAEKVAAARFDAGRIDLAEMEFTRYQRLDAEIQLLKEKKAAEAKPK